MPRPINNWTIGSLVVFALVCAGCGSDSSGPGAPPADFSGSWDLDFEVVGKRLCDSTLGETLDGGGQIAQDGQDATLVIDPTTPIALTVRGTRAVGVHTRGDESLEFVLRITESGELSGTMTYTDTTIPCTEVSAIAGIRDNVAPSVAFAGDWTLETEVTESACDGATEGEMETFCRRIRVENNTVTIEDPLGGIRGVGNGARAVLRRWTETERSTYYLDVDGDQITGEIERYDLIEECYTMQSVIGTRSTEECDNSASR